MKPCPTKKHRFRDHDEAIRALRAIARKQKRRERTPIRVYDCGLCAGWHLTAQPEPGKEPKS